MLIFIPGKTPSSKNSRITLRKSGITLPSKAVTKWRKDTLPYWGALRKDFVKQCIGKEEPFIVGMHFVRGTRHRWDFVNPVQTVQDEMVKQKWIEDDNTHFMLPVPLNIEGSYWSYDKMNPGVYIKVLSSIEEASFKFSKHTTTCTI